MNQWWCSMCGEFTAVTLLAICEDGDEFNLCPKCQESDAGKGKLTITEQGVHKLTFILKSGKTITLSMFG